MSQSDDEGPLECETCDGRGRVRCIDDVVTDRGTMWQRSAEYEYTTECPACSGTGWATDGK